MSTLRPRLAAGSAARGRRFVLLASQFNRPVTLALIRGATQVLRRAGASASAIRVVWVPGAFELPVAAARAVRRRPAPDAVLALGALIRGATPQHLVIAHAVAGGLTHVAVTSGIPVTFGVIVAETRAQAVARAGLPAPRRGHWGKARQAGGFICNRGEEAALAALALLKTFNEK